MPKLSREKRTKSKKKKSHKKSKRSKSGRRNGKENKKESIQKEKSTELGSKKSSKKNWFWRKSKSKDKKRKSKKNKKEKPSKHDKRSKLPYTKKGKPSADDGKDKKHWIEEEFLQPGPHGGKLKRIPKRHKERKKRKVEEVLPVMETQPSPSLSGPKNKKSSKEAADKEVRPSGMDMTKKLSGEYPVVISETPIKPAVPAPPPPLPVHQEIAIVQREKKKKPEPDEKVYGIKPEKPEKEKAKMEPSLPLQKTQDDETSPRPKIKSPKPLQTKMSSPKLSYSFPIGALPMQSSKPPASKESVELTPSGSGEKLRVNIDEILRLGGIMERRGMSTSKKMSFEWIALNRHIVHQQPEAFSSHLIAAVGDVRLEKSLACDALNVLMYQHTVSPDEYLRLCQHLDTVQPITIGLLAQLLKTNTKYYSSVHNLRSQTLQSDVLPTK